MAPVSELAHHGECCARARAWLLARSRTADFTVTDRVGGAGPRWLSDMYEWGPTRWPVAWCEVVHAKTIVPHAAFWRVCPRDFRHKGVKAYGGQVVRNYDRASLAHYRNMWARLPGAFDWIGEEHVYHEVCILHVGEDWGPRVRPNRRTLARPPASTRATAVTRPSAPMSLARSAGATTSCPPRSGPPSSIDPWAEGGTAAPAPSSASEPTRVSTTVRPGSMSAQLARDIAKVVSRTFFLDHARVGAALLVGLALVSPKRALFAVVAMLVARVAMRVQIVNRELAATGMIELNAFFLGLATCTFFPDLQAATVATALGLVLLLPIPSRWIVFCGRSTCRSRSRPTLPSSRSVARTCGDQPRRRGSPAVNAVIALQDLPRIALTGLGQILVHGALEAGVVVLVSLALVRPVASVFVLEPRWRRPRSVGFSVSRLGRQETVLPCSRRFSS